jgi:hypothetical protein
MNSYPLYIQMTMEVSYTRKSPSLTVVERYPATVISRY